MTDHIINKDSEITWDTPLNIAWTEMKYSGVPFWTNKFGLAPEGEELDGCLS